MKKLLLAVVFSMGVFATQANTIYSYRNTVSGIGADMGFRQGYPWVGGAVPSKGNDYVITNDVRCGQFPQNQSSSTDVFGGDSLQIGVAGGNPGTLRYNSYGKVQVKRLILVNGTVIDGDGSDSTLTFDGGITEVLKTDEPFKYGADNYRNFAFVNGHQFKGGEDAAILLDADNRDLTLGSGSPEYYGKMIFQCGTLSLGDADAFGGPRTEPTVDAVKFNRIASTVNEVVTFDFSGNMAAANRGIMLSSNGSPTFTFPAGNQVRCLLPISGGSTLTVNGEGTKWFGTISTPNLQITEGVGGCENFNGSRLTLGANAKFGVEMLSGGVVTPMTIAEGATLVTEGDKIPLHVYGVLPLTNATTRIAVMKIPTSAKVVKGDDFVVTAEDLGLSRSLSAEVTEVGGVQTVWFVMTCNVVYYSKYNASAAFNQGGAFWSDGKAVHGDADYVIGYDVPDDCKRIRGVAGATFAGKSLTFVNGATFMMKGSAANPSTIDNLRMFPGSNFEASENANLNSFAGTVTFCGQRGDDPVVFKCGDVNNIYRSYAIQAEMKGSGPIRFEPQCAGDFEISFGRTSPEFTGAIFVNGNGNSRICNFSSLTNELQFGGNPAVFNPGQLYANTKLTLKATDTFAIDDPNRGITLANGVMTIDVATGKTMTLDVPVVMNANITKTGLGTLGIGGSYSGSARKFNVNAGQVMPVSRVGVEGVVVALASGTGLDIALHPADGEVKLDGYYVKDANSLAIAGSTLPVTVRGDFTADDGVIRLGLLNVPSSMADAIATKINGRVSFVRDGRTSARPLPVYRETLADDRVRFWTEISHKGLFIVIK